MSQTGPWSVKGIDQRARDAAREAAMAEGITLGEYLNRLLMSADEPNYNEPPPLYENAPYANPSYRGAPRAPRSDYRGDPRPPQDAASALERLSRRIEATEARSTLAITGIDHTVLGLVARIQNSEQTSAAIAGHVEGLIEEMRATHEALQAKVRRLEQDDNGKQNLEALKALEEALGKLADHVFEEAEFNQNDAHAIKGRIEAGFTDVTDRVEAMETKVERSLSETAARIDRAVEQAEQRAEGVTRHLSERMGKLEGDVREQASRIEGDLLERSQQLEAELISRLDDLELQTASRLSDAQTADQRLGAVEEDVSGALTSMEATLLRVQERLNRAETTTDTALKGLETSFASLDQRIDAVARTVDPELAGRLRQEFEARFEDITALVRSAVDTARLELAGEIARTAESEAQKASELRSEIGQLKARLAEVETRDPEEMTSGVREEIERLGTTVSERIDALAEQVETRLEESEIRSADAIEQVGEQVTVAAIRLQKRQDEALSALAQEIEASRKTADARLSDALSNVSERIEEIQGEAATSLSPVQRAIAALASRLENLEAFTAPPGAEIPPPALTPEPPTAFTEADEAAAELAPLPEIDADTGFESGFTFEDLIPQANAGETTSGASDFEAGFEEWSEPSQIETPEDETEEGLYGSDFDAIRAAVERLSSVTGQNHPRPEDTPSEPDAETPLAVAEATAEAAAPDTFFEDAFDYDFEDDAFVSGIEDGPSPAPEDYDPLAELAGLEEARSEARESDIFDDIDEGASFIAETTSDEPVVAEDLIDTLDNVSVDQDAETSDYIARARRAAMAAADTQSKPRRQPSSAQPGQKPRGPSRTPLLIAASAAVLTGAAAGGYLYMRGKQPHEPALSGPVDTYIDPVLASASPPAEEAAGLTAEDMAAYRNAMAGLAEEPTPGLPPEVVQKMADEDELFDSAAAAIEEDIFETPASPSLPAPAPKTAESAPVATLASLSTQPAASYPQIPAVVTVETEANAGNAIAQYQLAQSKMTAGDVETAIPLLRRAALKGIAPAQYDLGKFFEQGIGVDQDMTQARSLISDAADAGHVGAMYDLALFMAEGEGGAMDETGAIDWFRKAANHGFLDAQYNLGVMYAEGIGAEQDLAEALYWFELASRRGDSGAALEVRNLSQRLPTAAVNDAIKAAEAWSEVPTIALANGRFGAQRWNTGNPLQVQAVQTALSRLGYLSGAADGVLGPQTANAIRDYQRREGLPLTGTVTPDLIERLNTGAAPARG